MTVVNIPKNLITNYLARRHIDYQNCTAAIINKDFDTVTRIAHQIKGNALSFGFNNLGNIAINLEKSALKKDIHNLNLIMNEFSIFLTNHKI